MISKDIHNVMISFEILDRDCHVPLGCKKVTGNMIFDVKMDFTRKARWVLYGNKTGYPEVSLYDGVCFR